MIINVVYFGSIFVAGLVGQFLYKPLPYVGEPVGVDWFLLALDWPLMILGIFVFNLVLSGFVFVTLPGLVFFPLSVVALMVRAVFWSVMLNQLPTPLFMAVFPTLILEGEAYVCAGVAGISLGLSWLKPEWAYEKEGFSRLESFRKALNDCVRIYILAAVLLFASAVAETATIILLQD